jgi:hypothetical protein
MEKYFRKDIQEFGIDWKDFLSFGREHLMICRSTSA